MIHLGFSWFWAASLAIQQLWIPERRIPERQSPVMVTLRVRPSQVITEYNPHEKGLGHKTADCERNRSVNERLMSWADYFSIERFELTRTVHKLPHKVLMEQLGRA